MLRRLAAPELRAVCSPEDWPFHTSEELAPLEGLIGQDRAEAAASFGIGMKAAGYNLFVVGPPATGKASSMRVFLRRAADAEPTPSDWCYVHNFDDPYRPLALDLPAGRGRELRDELARTVEASELRLGRLFETEHFLQREAAIGAEFSRQERQAMDRADGAVRPEGFTVWRSHSGLALAALRDDRPLTAEEFEALPRAERDSLEARGRDLQALIEPAARELRHIERQQQVAREELLRTCAAEAIQELWSELRRRFAGLEALEAHLRAVEKDLVSHAERFRHPSVEAAAEGAAEGAAVRSLPPGTPAGAESPSLSYRVNVLVDRGGTRGAPVVTEPNPSYANLFGRIEHRMRLGSLVTDVSLIRPGALHQANGGYLLLEAQDLVQEELAWAAFKKALKARCIRIEDPAEEPYRLSTTGLAPEAIALSVKLVLLGSPLLYHVLYEVDEDFRELFKVKVEFDDSLPRTPESQQLLARFVAGACTELKLRPFSTSALSKLIEHSSREVAHQERLSARFGQLVDLLREANYWAGERGQPLVEASDVSQAISRKVARSNLLEEQLARLTREQGLLISTDGEAVGQVNGLAVLSTGDHEFGRPFRITARTRPGKPGVIDVEREVGLGGSIHSKGVLILAGFVAGRYARTVPLAMSAYLASEQSYEEIEGDSASTAELVALLSSLSGTPVRQSLAITGAVNQRGEVQAVGGITQKVEGWFALCRERGLDGSHGVLIPASNARNLMLHEELVEAARQGLFHVHTIEHVDDALGLLTGREAGQVGPGGSFPPGSVNAEVERQLLGWAERVGWRAREE